MSERILRRICHHCGKVLASGALAYRMRGLLASDFDGVLPEIEADSLRAGMEEALQAATRQSANRAEADVALEFDQILCPACRTLLEREWLEDRRGDPVNQNFH